MTETKCSVTVMLVCDGTAGFIRRDPSDTFGGLLVAPGGKIEMEDFLEVHEDTPYFSVEAAALREIIEETGIELERDNLRYFCSLTLPNGRIVISFWALVENPSDGLEWYTAEQIQARDDFAPGMKQEALLCLSISIL